MNPRRFRVSSEKQRSISRAGDEPRGATVAQIFYHSVALLAIRYSKPDLDKLVVCNGSVEFLQQRVGDACVTDQDDRLELVAKAAQELFLCFGQLHEVEL